MAMYRAGDPLLITLSVVVAVLASFTAMNLAGRLIVADRKARLGWICAAALALGGGTWAMHFTGMLATHMTASYDLRLTSLSLVLPIVASAVGFAIVSRSKARIWPLTWSGFLVAAGIVAMHYIGMAAMRMPGVTFSYDWRYVVASVAIAIGAATLALWLAFGDHDTIRKLAASAAMGIGISGMHYTAMAGVTFVVDDAGMAEHSASSTILVFAVVGISTSFLLLGLVTAHFDRALATLTSHETAALVASEERYRALNESTSDMIGIVDRQGVFTYENSSALKVLGYSSEDLIGRMPIEFVTPAAVADTRMFFAKALERPALSTRTELPLLDKNGAEHQFEVVATNLLHIPSISGVVVNLRDITERKQMMARLKLLSETDLLTGALNRRGFAQTATVEFERMRRRGGPVVVAMIDIDHFKSINDTYGHAGGDKALIAVAECCRQHIRSADLFARVGGEEFVILLADSDVQAAENAVDRLRLAIAGTRIPTIDARVTASFGIAAVDPARRDLEGAMRRADEALYAAKSAGRNCIRMVSDVFEPYD